MPAFDFNVPAFPELNFQSIPNKNSISYVAACTRPASKSVAFIAAAATNALFIIRQDLSNKTAPGPSAGVQSIAAMGDGLVASTSSGNIYYSPDEGDTWSLVQATGSSCVVCSNGFNLAFAVANNATTWKSVDGVNWVNVSLDFPGITTWNASAVVAKFVNGEFYLFARTTDGVKFYRMDSAGNFIDILFFVPPVGPAEYNSVILFKGINSQTGGIAIRYLCMTDNSLDLYNVLDVTPSSPPTVSPVNGLVASYGGNKTTTGTNYILNFEYAGGRLYIGRSYGLEYFANNSFKPVTIDNVNTPVSVYPMAVLGNDLIVFSTQGNRFFKELNSQ